MMRQLSGWKLLTCPSFTFKNTPEKRTISMRFGAAKVKRANDSDHNHYRCLRRSPVQRFIESHLRGFNTYLTFGNSDCRLNAPFTWLNLFDDYLLADVLFT